MTLIRMVKGFVNSDLRRKKVQVHFTSDAIGETLSITYGGTQFTLPYAQIEQIVKREREKGYKDGHLIIDENRLYIPVEWISEQEDAEKYAGLLERWEKDWEEVTYS